MDSFLTGRGGTLLTRDWVQMLVAAARRHGLDGDVIPVRGWLGGAMLIACVRRLGGTVRPDDPFYGWILRDEMDNLDSLDDWAPELKVGEVRIGDFHGVVAIELRGETFLALRTDEPISHSAVVRTLVLAGPSLEATMRLSADLARVRRELLQTNRVMVFGTSQRLYSPKPVAEEDLILPPGFKRDLLGFVDGFGRAAEICRRLKVWPSRGALFVGAAGTGKTQAVRHLMTRLPSFRTYIITVPNGVHECGSKTLIERLLEQMQELGDPGIVVIEDIDRLFETKVLTPQFFLNVLDGMFQPVQPVLWIATSNDPRGFEANLLDRPGRFDRVFAFPMPGQAERFALLQRYAAWPLDTDDLDRLSRDSDGLSGAHLREVCYAAALEVAEHPAEFATECRQQLEKVRVQHAKARSYDFELGERKVGFG